MIPRSWDELTDTQAIAIAPFALRSKGNLGVKMKAYEALLPPELLPVYAKLSAKEIQPLLRDVNWIYETPVTKPHIRSFTINNIAYLLPREDFKNVRIIEYSYANQFYDELFDKKSFKALNKVIASLCRPAKKDVDTESPDYDGDPRERFNPELIDQRAELFDNLPMEFKAYFLLLYNGCSEHIVKQFKPLFGEGGDDGKSKTPNFGWLGIIMSLADAGVFGSFEQTQYTFLYTAMAYRLKKYYEAKELNEVK